MGEQQLGCLQPVCADSRLTAGFGPTPGRDLTEASLPPSRAGASPVPR